MSADGRPFASRWPADAYARRIGLEARKRVKDIHLERGGARVLLTPYYWIEKILKWSGKAGAGRHNFLNPKVHENTVELSSLPFAFDGFRILHLSDMHFDLDPALADVVQECVQGLSYDICLMTGDFRDRLTVYGDHGVALCAKLAAGLGKPVFACLGNHDIAADVDTLEAAGVRVLVNESEFLERERARLYISGVDDFGYFGTDDFAAAFAQVPQGACCVLMCHDPGGYEKAEAAKASLMLSGHTHGGQICLPGGYAPLTHSGCGRDMVAGAWVRGALHGYTTRGVGCSRIAARFFCHGEIVVHTLRRACD